MKSDETLHNHGLAICRLLALLLSVSSVSSAVCSLSSVGCCPSVIVCRLSSVVSSLVICCSALIPLCCWHRLQADAVEGRSRNEWHETGDGGKGKEETEKNGEAEMGQRRRRRRRSRKCPLLSALSVVSIGDHSHVMHDCSVQGD